MAQAQDHIGVFDSGVGGLSVLQALLQQLPKERFYYFGDSANAPYGSRSTEEIRALTLAAGEHLVKKGIKALVVACNTATAAAIGSLRETYPQLIVIGIEPALKPAVDHHRGGCIGVMATEATLREEKFDRLLHRVAEGCHVVKLPCPGLVELIEEGRTDSPEMQALLEEKLGAHRGKLDALVLGCTHYPFAKAAIAKILPGTELLDGGDGTARETARRLQQAGLLWEGPGELILENSGGETMLRRCKQLLGGYGNG